nr:hypothetical protein [Angustibacter aerolatus]
MTLQAGAGRSARTTTAALPAGFRTSAWHAVSLQVRGRDVRAQVSHARLGDPVADLSLRLPRSLGTASGADGVVALGRGVHVDDLSALASTKPVTRVVRDVVPSRLVRSMSDEFSGSALGAGWSWVRPDAAATVSGGALRWPTEAADLTGPDNTAGVLLRDAPQGAWTAETKRPSTSAPTTSATSSRAG